MERLERTLEELANAVTHGIGLVLSLLGGGVLIALAAFAGDYRLLIGVAIFGASLVLLYTASTCYHAVRRRKLKEKLRLFDHLAILYLIAGSYTPFALVLVRGFWGYLMLALVWGLALYGTLYKLFSKRRYENGATWIYLVMGWLVVLFAGPMIASVPTGALLWLAAGGLLYTGGVFFFLRERWRFDHATWHVFVLGGSVCHYLAVLLYVAM